MTLAGSASGLECNELVQTAITREMKQSTVTSLPHLSFVRLMHYVKSRRFASELLVRHARPGHAI